MGESNNEKTQDNLRKQQKLRVMLHDQDLGHVLQDQAGRRLVWRIINDIAGIHDVPMGCDGHDYFINGKRHVGQILMRECQRVASSQYVHMVQEALDLQREDTLQREVAKGKALTETDEDA